MRTFDFQWNYSSSVIIERKGFGPVLNRKLAEICREYMEPYTPYDTGRLANDVQIRTRGKDGASIVYLTPYAKYQYVGASWWNRNKTVHPLATSYWDRAAITNHKTQIVQEVNKYRKEIAK